ncbi:methyltransferase [Paenarthrobacter sp. DKR-5]|uniref:DUF7059 domain-containing protein n=1 Tax=Paenarthrobacter sp. DKR-5 TaxID=2835535 RepID=UPI001BDC7A53|nr:methyltransferase [Paenarthrobacter sp. DKR-5]MBT1001326.1 methyltransferase [Paenarthrobacter sp. DKR-5]
MPFNDKTAPADVPSSADHDRLEALAADLRAANYTVDGVAALLGESAYAAFNRDQPLPARLALRGRSGDPLGTLVRLWLLADPVPAADVETALPSVGADGLRRMGLAARTADGMLASCDLRPYGWERNEDGTGGAELWVASDLAAHQRPGVLRRDHVLGIGHASLTLAQTTIRRHARLALDLGTGCGIQTFHLLHHADRVVATDLSDRALAFTRFNLLLNAEVLGLDRADLSARVDLRQGSLLEPVAGEQFDLVVSNPPFVITPRTENETAEDRFTYRDAGMAGDDLVAGLIRGIPAVLAPGGHAQLLGNWEVRGGQSSQERPSSWLADDVDAWIIQREQLGPEQYAETWLQDASENRDPDLFEAAYGAYLADFASRGVAGIGFGMVWLRRPPAGKAVTLRRFEEITYPVEQPLGPHLAAAVERADWLSGHDLAAAHLLVADDVTEERHQRPGAEHPGVILLRKGAGLRRTNLLSSELAGFVSACDGELTAGQIAGALAALLDREDPDFRQGLLDDAANLVRDGFLLPATA